MILLQRFNASFSRAGFTLVEMIIIMALFLILIQISSVSLLNFQRSVSLRSNVNVLIADIRQQQLRALAGDTTATGTSQPFGVYFEQDQYTLFTGSFYDPSSPTNFVVRFDQGVIMGGTSFAGSSLVFAPVSGEVASPGINDYVTLTNQSDGRSTTIRFNALGVPTESS